MSGSEKPSFSGALAVGRELDLLLPDSPAIMTLQFIHAYAIELEGSVSSKRPHLRGPGSLKKVVSLLRDGIDPR